MPRSPEEETGYGAASLTAQPSPPHLSHPRPFPPHPWITNRLPSPLPPSVMHETALTCVGIKVYILLGFHPLPSPGCPKASKVHRVPVEEVRSLRSKCRQVHPLPRRLQEGRCNLVHSPVVPGDPRQVAALAGPHFCPPPLSSRGFLFCADPVNLLPACLLSRPNSLDSPPQHFMSL